MSPQSMPQLQVLLCQTNSFRETTMSIPKYPTADANFIFLDVFLPSGVPIHLPVPDCTTVKDNLDTA
jgi:hypothetical protein